MYKHERISCSRLSKTNKEAQNNEQRRNKLRVLFFNPLNAGSLRSLSKLVDLRSENTVVENQHLNTLQE